MTWSGNDASWSRRKLLGVGGSAAALTLTPALPALAMPAYTGTESDTRSLAFYNLHTQERIKVDYFMNGAYEPEAMRALNRFMRDPRDHSAIAMDPGLIDLLYALHAKMETSQPFHLISGYRSPRTNAWLRRRGRGVAKNSLHMRGLAADVRLPGRDLRSLWRAARSLRRGGVGLYTRSDFVHVDIGRVRYWGA